MAERESGDTAEHETERRYKFAVGLWLRVIAAGSLLSVLSLFTACGWAFPYSDSYPAYYGLGSLVAVNGVYWLVGLWCDFPLRHFYCHWFVDLVLIGMVVYGLGGSSLLPAITGYMLIVVSSAVFISKRASYVVATGGAIAFGGSSVAEMLGWIQPAHGVGDPEFAVGAGAFVMAGSVMMVYLSAYIAGTLGDQLNAANALLARKNSELKQQNENLDQLQKELEFQARVLTHDIRSPASATAAALSELRRELLRDGEKGEVLDLLTMAEANIDRIHEMIEVLQEIQEAGRVLDEKGDISLAGVMEEVAIELRPEVVRKKVAIVLEKELPAIRGVRQKVLVLFRNLLSNAIRYLPDDGTGVIRIGARDVARESQIFVANNGEGIPPEYCAKIFEMFRKAPQKSGSGGMGVGLALVRRIAEQHGGKAWAESDGQTGAVFWVSFPKG